MKEKNSKDKKKVAIILGSGATVGANFKVKIDGILYDPPMDRDFFETLPVLTILNQDTYPALHYYRRELNENSLEALFSNIDLISKLCLGGIISEKNAYDKLKDKMEAKARKDSYYKNKLDKESEIKCNTVPSMAAWELYDLLIEIYKNLKPPNPSITSPMRILIDGLLKKGLLNAIVTFNYDLAVEALFNKKFESIFYYPCFDNQNEKLIPIFKLHGSLNWKENSNKIGFNITLEKSAFSLNYIRANTYTQPSLIAPTLFKQEINIDYQHDIRGRFYKNLWKKCWEHLQKGDAIIIVGFSFPSTDWHARVLFESVSRGKGGFDKIVYCHKGDPPKIVSTVKSIFNYKKFYEESKGLENLSDNIDALMKFIESDQRGRESDLSY